MSKKFNWSKFDGAFLSSVVYNEKTKKDYQPSYRTNDADELVPSMNRIAPIPGRDFILTYRTEIEFQFLKKHPNLVAKIYDSKDSSNYLTMLNDLSQRTMGSNLLLKYISALYEVGECDFLYEDESKYQNPVSVNLKTSIADDVKLFDFQAKAVKALHEYFMDHDNQNGLLVMPTGSGKTRTAVTFLLKSMVSQGYQVVWLTHRHMLIDQTADAFFKFAPLVKIGNPNAKIFNMACVSGHHASIKCTQKSDHVMILSVQSVCRSLDYLRTVLGKKVVIVVDEAHHTVARSYESTIKYIRKFRKDAKLLGLTATPVRGMESENKYLMYMYNSKIIYSVSMSELIKNGTLAEPVFQHVFTDENFEPEISLDEEKFLKKWGELPETLVDKIAKSSARNALIVQQYLNHKAKYGKTLIFALNGYHAFTLCEDLKKNGVSCDYVYSLNDGNTEKINRFKNGSLDVLVNINILTEGSDVPDIQTVFLTRPTQSDVLLMQMIGRGMRGKQAGGTENVNIVDFCDKWDNFNRWLNPKWLLDGEMTQPGAPDVGWSSVRTIPVGLIRDIYRSMRFPVGNAEIEVAMPYGWYNLLKDDEDYSVLVFEDQLKGYENIIRDRKILLSSPKLSIDTIVSKYFSGFVLTPRVEDAQLFLENLLEGEEAPTLFVFDDRHQIDPGNVAKNIMDEKLNFFTTAEELYKKYAVVEEIYGSLENYRQSIFNILNRSGNPLGSRVEEMPIEQIPFILDNPYDLDQLVQEVKEEMFGGTYAGIKSITWTEKPMQSYFGICSADKKIVINTVLNSSQVPKEAVKYIIYHEMLHRDYWNHDKTFRTEEHRYPDYTELERFLDYQFWGFTFEW